MNGMFENVVALMTTPSSSGAVVVAAHYADGTVVQRLDAAGPDAVAAFLPESCICVAHGKHAETLGAMSLLDLRRRILLDTRALAQVLLPSLGHYDLRALGERFDIRMDAEPGADASVCDRMLDLFSALTGMALTLPLPVLFEMHGVLKGKEHRGIRHYFEKIEQLVTARASSDRPQSLLNLIVPGSQPRPRQDESSPEAYHPLDVHETEAVLGEAGPFAAHLAQYEWREGQITMARAVVKAFNHSGHLMVEAGTGTGKSLAYLVPAVQWALRNHTPVVVSTNTKNLQSQLFEKDLPLIQRVMGVAFKTALIKGRGNYCCIRKLVYLLDHAGFELPAPARLVMAAVLPWVATTRTGDLGELGLLSTPAGRGLAVRLSSTADECGGRGCRYYRQCFLRRARAKALAADIVVANHALIFAEMSAKGSALPPYAHLILDEAHNIEDAATRHFAVEISPLRIRFPLRRLGRLKKKRGSHGLVASLVHQIDSGSLTGSKTEQDTLRQLTQSVSRWSIDVESEMPPFFATLSALLKRRRESRRLTAADHGLEVWPPVERAQQTFQAALAGLSHAIAALVKALRELESEELGFCTECIQDLEAQRAQLLEISENIAFVLGVDNEAYVYWVEPDGRREHSARAWAAPIEIGELLHDELYQQKASIIFTSATLSVRGSFQFVQNRLGIDRIEPERLTAFDAGTPFDYAGQCSMMIPMFLPEPNDTRADYTEALSEFLAALFRRTEGRAMTLFTSYAMLQRTTQCVRSALDDSEVEVLAQGEASSREVLTARFRDQMGSVLMGTHSFWEGVDVVGESLSCVVLARLPFAVFTDPIVAARCERVEARGQSAFMHYSIPNAVIRFRQGFGRLIRHRADRGVVIVADRRIMTKRYGHWFRGSVPANARKFYDPESMLQAVEQFLA